MNYEELYKELQSLEKELKDSLAQAQKLYKGAVRDTENGDLKSLGKELASLLEQAESQAETVKSLQSAVEGFDGRAYLESGEFTEQMLAYCEEKEVDVKGEYPVFEMFPYKVKMDAESQDIFIDRKKVQCLRPLSLVQTVKKGQERLTKANFNSLSFANELADAYDAAIVIQGKQPEADIYLTSLYKILVPMGRFRKEYDQQSFAFDLARLYASYTSGADEIKDGRKFQFGPSRKINKSIRILDKDGKEEFLSTIRYYKREKEF